ncbi:Enhancer of polycomb-like protein 1 [Coemansia sp. RSA 2708]|nr:Enhancer of polycomb-like protein 1 [Coemansia sp. RSA 2708]
MDVDAFETAMDQLETLTRDMVFQSEADIPTIEYLAAHAADREQPFDTNACTRVYMHWRHRRSDRGFRTVEARLQQEDTSKTEIDPYVCFRRREIQRGRKTRRADQRSLEQLRRLRLNLAMAAQLLELCLEREAAKLRAAGEAQAVAAQRAEVVRMRRRVGATGSSWDELFVPPAQPGAARKRLARDPLRARVPRKTKGNSSAGAGDLALPLPFVLPRAVSVQPYVNVRRLQVAQSRIEARTQTCESRLSAWVDSTYAAPVSSEPALFWPAGIDGLRALRVRRGRLGRLFVDRRAVRSCPMDDERQQQFRLGLLRPEDHERLRQCRAPPASAAPDELLKPFAFANALLTPPESTVDELGATRSTLSAGTQDESEPATPPAPMAHPQLPLALAALSPRIGSGSAPLSTAKCN